MAEEAPQPGGLPEAERPVLEHQRDRPTRRGENERLPPLVIDMAGDRVPAAAERIVVIDKRAFRRECVARMLRDVLPEYSVAALERAHDPLGNACGPKCGRQVDLVILDIGWTRLPDERLGADVRFLQGRFQGVAIILLSDREESAHVAAALGYGVRGLIPTALGAGVVAEAVRLVGAGGTFVPASAVVHALSVRQDGTGRARGGSGRATGLTPRECEVLNLLREGKPNKIIAAALDLQETTVKIHVRHIMKKLKARNRTEAALIAERVL